MSRAKDKAVKVVPVWFVRMRDGGYVTDAGRAPAAFGSKRYAEDVAAPGETVVLSHVLYLPPKRKPRKKADQDMAVALARNTRKLREALERQTKLSPGFLRQSMGQRNPRKPR